MDREDHGSLGGDGEVGSWTVEVPCFGSTTHEDRARRGPLGFHDTSLSFFSREKVGFYYREDLAPLGRSWVGTDGHGEYKGGWRVRKGIICMIDTPFLLFLS